MPLKFDQNILFFLITIAVLVTFVALSRFKKGIVIKSIVKLVLGAAFIYLFNLALGNRLNIGIPLNPFTVIVTGFLEVPGIALIYVVKYIVFPI